ncbi:hypothetical protein F4778DRAFT_762866 [Xylariomycetidae sp. FL2044]|nr:hypothetical protein F4778DRAFT_762866 [Xylariomycetidae sp. FL2044]
MMSSHYEWKMLNIFPKYGISSTAVTLFKKYEEYKTGCLDEASLGSLIRLSSSNRASLTTTLVKCAGLMDKKPGESKYLLAMISTCGDMIRIADKAPAIEGFPSFLRLPIEIRHRIYNLHFANELGCEAIQPLHKLGSCDCPTNEAPPREPYKLKNMSLAYTSKRMRDEVLSYFYRNQTLFFFCACEMNHHLTTNALLKANIRFVKFHWTGAAADQAIKNLNKARVEDLIVVISKSTGKQLNHRESETRRWFQRPSPAILLPDAMGYDELLALRGISTVRVEHVLKKAAQRRTDSERSTLQRLLEHTVKKPHPDGSMNRADDK